jgi:putative phosphoribosyl transferase
MISILTAAERHISVPVGNLTLPGTLAWPEHPSGVVILAPGTGPAGRRQRTALVARQLRAAGLATLLVELLTPREREAPAGGFETAVVADRLQAATEWALEQPEVNGLVPGFLGIGNGAGAALLAAAAGGLRVGAVVSHAGRPDLAADALYAIRAPTLLIAAGHDEAVLEPNRRAYRCLSCVKRLVVIPSASGAFEDGKSMEEVGRWTAEWLVQHLVMVPRWAASRSGSGSR